MTSLIFWVPYTAHHVWNERRREKQRVRNYERWEGLRDEYDEQRRTQSLDLQRTGAGYGGWDQQQQQTGDAPRSSMDGYSPYPAASRPILTLRDQQEANDARTSWRPQEAWDQPRTQLQAQMTSQQLPGQSQQPYDAQQQRHASVSPAYMQPQQTGSLHSLPLRAQKTGATWDEGLPARLQVSRRSYEEDEYAHRYRMGSATGTPATGASRQSSMSRESGRDSARPSLGGNNVRTHTPSGLSREAMATTQQQQQYSNSYESSRRSPDMQVTQVIELPKNEFGFVEPAATAAVPGGRMAEILERGY